MGFFAKLKKRSGLDGALFLYGFLRVAPVLLFFATILFAWAKIVEPSWVGGVVAWLPSWTGLTALFFASFTLFIVGVLCEARINDLTEREEAAKPQDAPISSAAKTQKTPPPKCLHADCMEPCPEKPKGGFRRWCLNCWVKRETKFKDSGKLPQCVSEGCPEVVENIYFPWCRKCSKFRKNNDYDPIVTVKGDKVDSLREKRIADFLYRNNIGYIYDKPLPNSGAPARRCDFFLPAKDGSSGGTYIEYFGWQNHSDEGKNYRDTMKKKLAYYINNNLKLIDLRPEHDDILEKHLAAELRRHGYNITAN